MRKTPTLRDRHTERHMNTEEKHTLIKTYALRERHEHCERDTNIVRDTHT